MVNLGSSFEQTWLYASAWCCILSFKDIGQRVPKKKIFKRFYHLWSWRPFWSCALDHLNKFQLPLRMEVSHEIWLRMALWDLREMFEIDEIWVTLDKDQWMTLTLDTHKSSCTHSFDFMCQFSDHRFQQFLGNLMLKCVPIQMHKGANLTLP